MQADDRPDLRDSPNQGSAWGWVPLGKDRSLWQPAQPQVDTELSHVLGGVKSSTPRDGKAEV